MCPVPSSLTSSLAQWTQSDQDLLDKSSGQTTLSSVCSQVFAVVVLYIYWALSFTVQTVNYR